MKTFSLVVLLTFCVNTSLSHLNYSYQECLYYNQHLGYQCPYQENDRCVSVFAVCSVNAENCIFPDEICNDPNWERISCHDDDKFSRCRGQRRGQCVFNAYICDGKYDCIDRSDESNCAGPQTTDQELVEGEKRILLLPAGVNKTEWRSKVTNHPNELCRNPQLQIGEVDHLFKHLKKCEAEFGTGGFTLDSGSVNAECVRNGATCDGPLSTPYLDPVECPPLARILKSRFFCDNPANFRDEGFCGGFLVSCSGNSPSNCYQTYDRCTARDDGGLFQCGDNSDYICDKNAPRNDDDPNKHNFTQCRDEGHFVCGDGSQCIHKTLLCDGYQQCEDASDEDQHRCSICPNFGFLRQGKPEDATFSCQHRYTNKRICAIPCNGEDDLCINNEDENLDLCREQKPVLIIISVIIGLLLIGSCLGEIIYRVDFKSIQEHREIDSESLVQFMGVIEREEWDYKLLESLFNRIHDEGHIKKLITLLGSKVKSNYSVGIYQTLYQYEVSIHDDNVINAELCLKDKLGTNVLAEKFMDYVEFGAVTKIKLKITDFVDLKTTKIDPAHKAFIVNMLLFLLNVTVYYLDLIKDIFFIIFIKNLIKEVNNDFQSHILLTLILILCVSEVSKFVSLISMKNDLNLTRRGLLLILLTLPFMPAILLYIKSRLSYNRFFLTNNTLDTQIDKINNLMTRIKRNENALENFPQLIVICIIIGITSSATTPITTLKTIFDPKNPMLYVTGCLSVITVIRASAGQLKASLNGFLPFKGQLLYMLFILISVASRLAATFLYFAPSLGLIPILSHWEFGSKEVGVGIGTYVDNVEYIYGIIDGQPKPFKEVWKVTSDITFYTWTTYHYYALIYLILALFHMILITFIVSGKYEFKLDAVGMALDSLLSPALDGISSIFIFTCSNLTLMFPMWILRHNISRRNEYLDELFSQLDEEIFSTHLVNILVICGSICFGVVIPILQCGLIKVYKTQGQPWQRVANINKGYKSDFFSQLKLLNIYQ